MDHIQKNRIINIIQSDFLFADNIIIEHPTANIRNMADYYYQQDLDFAIQIGMATENELINANIKIGIWTNEKNEKISRFEKDIYNIKKSLLDFIFNKDKLEKMRSILRQTEKKMIELLEEKHNLINESAEVYASARKQKFLLMKTAIDQNKNPIWKDIKEMENEKRTWLITNLIYLYFNKFRFSQNIFREIARSDPWRSIWKAGKMSGQVFNRSTCDWSDNQIDLVRWSIIYDNIFEGYEKPSYDIIEDDDLLDSWIIRQSEKNEAKQTMRHIDQNTKPQNGRREVMVVTDEQSSQKVYSLNDPFNRAKIQAKQKIINTVGVLAEEKAPDSQDEMRFKAKLNAVKR